MDEEEEARVLARGVVEESEAGGGLRQAGAAGRGSGVRADEEDDAEVREMTTKMARVRRLKIKPRDHRHHQLPTAHHPLDDSPLSSPLFRSPPRPGSRSAADADAAAAVAVSRKRTLAPTALHRPRALPRTAPAAPAAPAAPSFSFLPPRPIRSLFLETSASPLLREFAKLIRSIQTKAAHPTLSELRHVVQLANSLYRQQRDRTNVPALIHWVGMAAAKVDPSLRPTPTTISELIMTEPRPVDDATKVQTIMAELGGEAARRVDSPAALMEHLTHALSLPAKADLSDELRRLQIAPGSGSGSGSAGAREVEQEASRGIGGASGMGGQKVEDEGRDDDDDELTMLLRDLSV